MYNSVTYKYIFQVCCDMDSYGDGWDRDPEKDRWQCELLQELEGLQARIGSGWRSCTTSLTRGSKLQCVLILLVLGFELNQNVYGLYMMCYLFLNFDFMCYFLCEFRHHFYSYSLIRSF